MRHRVADDTRYFCLTIKHFLSPSIYLIIFRYSFTTAVGLHGGDLQTTVSPIAEGRMKTSSLPSFFYRPAGHLILILPSCRAAVERIKQNRRAKMRSAVFSRVFSAWQPAGGCYHSHSHSLAVKIIFIGGSHFRHDQKYAQNLNPPQAVFPFIQGDYPSFDKNCLCYKFEEGESIV